MSVKMVFFKLKKIMFFSFLFFIGIFFAPNIAYGSDSITIANGFTINSISSINPININSSSTALLRLTIKAEESARRVEQISVDFSGNGFVVGDLKSITTNGNSGVAVYEESQDDSSEDGDDDDDDDDEDNNSSQEPNGFDDDDELVRLHNASGWSGSRVILYLNDYINIPSGKEKTIYIVIKTSSSAVNGHQIIGTIPANGVLFSDEVNGPVLAGSSNALTIDTQGPSIISVEATNPRTIFVKYSEAVDEESAINKDNYSLSGGISLIQINKQSSNIYKIITSDDITIDSTNLTISENIYDLVNNNSTQTSVSITNLMMVKISEFSTYLNDARAEFIELYNSGDTEIDINGWSIQYREDNFSNWNSIAIINSATSIKPFGFYLFTSPFYTLSTTGDNAIPSGLSSLGGYLRLFDGEKEIDYVSWGDAISLDGFNSTSAHDPGESIERKAFGYSRLNEMLSGGVDNNMGNGWDSDDSSFDFFVQTNPDPQNSSSAIEQPNFTNYNGAAGTGPMINHMPISIAQTGKDLDIFAQVGDPQVSINNLSAEIHYSVGDGTKKTTHDSSLHEHVIGEHLSNGYFKFTIPQNHIDHADSIANGIYYHIHAVTNTGSNTLSSDNSLDHEAAANNPIIINIESSDNWNKHNITGIIKDKTESPISNAFIFLEGTGYSTTTDNLGNFNLINVKDGIYNLIVTKQGYYENAMIDILLNGSNQDIGNIIINNGAGGGLTGDNVKPSLLWTSPSEGMLGVEPGESDFKILISFSKDLDSSLFNTSTVILSSHISDPYNNPMTGYSVSFDNDSSDNTSSDLPLDNYLGIVSIPGGLVANTSYYLILSSNIRDTAGNPIQGNNSQGGHVIEFSTGNNFSSESSWSNYGSGDMQPPFIVSATPTNGDFAAPNTTINLKFSERMNKSSVKDSNNIKLYKVTVLDNQQIETPISISTDLDKSKKIAIITHNNLAAGKYKLVVTGALKSANNIWIGNPNQGQNNSSYTVFKSYFTVKNNASIDTTAPNIIGSWPKNGDSNVLINPGFINIQFSEGMDATTINKKTIILKRGTRKITGEVKYDSMGQSAFFIPSVVLMPGTLYSLSVKGGNDGVKDMANNLLQDNYTTVFTTEVAQDTQAPFIIFASGDDHMLAITFSEPMNIAKVVDTRNWPSSVLNPDNFQIKWGDPLNVSTEGNVIDLKTIGADFNHDGITNTLSIEGLGLNPVLISNKNLYIDTTPSNVAGTGIEDLSGNIISANTKFEFPILLSSETNSEVAPTMDEVGLNIPDVLKMGIMRSGVFPINTIAGQVTNYSARIPTTKQINDNYKVVLTFPVGFDISNAKKDTYSPVNDDLNNEADGIITFSSELETSGGANSDGVSINEGARTITVDLAVSGTTLTKDYIHFDIAGIQNSNIARNLSTGGYNIDIKILDSEGNLSESVFGLPFFIRPSGSSSLSGDILGINQADVNGSDDFLKVFLSSPSTGALETLVSINGSGLGEYSFSNLPTGQYSIFSQPNINFDGNSYAGISIPEPINLINGVNKKNLTLIKENSGSLAQVNISISGVPAGKSIDVYANSSKGFKVSTLTGSGSTISTKLYIPEGTWMIGVGPAAYHGREIGALVDSDLVYPVTVQVISDGSTEQSLSFNLASAEMEIIGYVQDKLGNAIANIEVYAYQPMSENKGSHAKTNINGKFVIKVGKSGNYSLGIFKQGLLNTQNRNILVLDNVNNNDNNLSADVYIDRDIVSDANSLIFNINKSNYTISGKVTDGENPVPSATIWANRQDGLGHIETISDDSGNYILYVDNGTWLVQSYIPGFGESMSQTIVINESSETQNLYPDSTLTHYSISGNISFEGVPQKNKLVRAIEYDSNGNLIGKEFNAQANENGDYIINNVPAGIYRVSVWTSDFGELERNDADDFNNSLANLNLNTNKTGVNINLASFNTITLNFVNGMSLQEAIINIEGVLNDNATGFKKIISLNDLSSSILTKLISGEYMFSMNIPGIGAIEPGINPVPITGNRVVEFTIPNNVSNIFTVSGIINDGANSIAGAQVWLVSDQTGVYLDTLTDSNGGYSLSVKSGTYSIGVEMPGYIPQESTKIVIDQNKQSDYTILQADKFINGRIYIDVNNNNTYNNGEEISNGWVRAEEVTSNKTIVSKAQFDGSFSIPVTDGTYILKANADGYSESTFGEVNINGDNSINNSIQLIPISNWDSKLISKPLIPSIGGTIDDSSSDGSGIKVVVPPNSLGSGISTISIKTKEITNVAKTNSANPLGGLGKDITATDDLGQAITNTNQDLEIELTYYKSDIELAITDYNKLNLLTNSYWDNTVNNWVGLATTKSVFIKNNANDSSWTAKKYSDFVNALIENSAVYADYKIILQSTSNHLTVFSATIPVDTTTPAKPTGLTQINGLGTSVSLDWSDNSETDIKEYKIYRSTSSGVSATTNNKVNSSQVSSSNYIDSTVSEWISYYYTISAVDDSGNESDIATEIKVCSNKTISNGTVTTDCVITCNSGYDLSGNSCIAQSSGGGGGSSGGSSGSSGGSSGGGGSSGSSSSGSGGSSSSGNESGNSNNSGDTNNYYNYEDPNTATTDVNDQANTNYDTNQTEVHWTDTYLATKIANAQANSAGNQNANGQSSQIATTKKVEEFEVASGQEIILMFQEILSNAKNIEMLNFVKKAFELINFYDINHVDKLFQERIIVMSYEAMLMASGNFETLLEYNVVKRDLEKEEQFMREYYEKLNLANKKREIVKSIMHFVVYGTKSTLRLGMGERAGVVNSFQSTYGHLPEDEFDWNDLIKIANGRWPTKDSEAAERRALINFEIVYLREPDRTNPNDDAAMMVMAYGLRPLSRNLDNERTGIKTFQYIYDYYPEKATAWDVVRAIANSGATR